MSLLLSFLGMSYYFLGMSFHSARIGDVCKNLGCLCEVLWNSKVDNWSVKDGPEFIGIQTSGNFLLRVVWCTLSVCMLSVVCCWCKIIWGAYIIMLLCTVIHFQRELLGQPNLYSLWLQAVIKIIEIKDDDIKLI